MEDGSSTSSEPHIEMRVKNGQLENQVIVGCYINNFTDLETIETVFTYDNRILQPSNYNTNTPLSNLEALAYANQPGANNASAQQTFNENSTQELSEALSIKYVGFDADLIRYLAPDGNNETVQFVTSKKAAIDNEEITSEDYVLMAEFSFKRINTELEIENSFTELEVAVVCRDLTVEAGIQYYYKDDASNCKEMMEFIYQKYGSISGKVDASVIKSNGGKFTSKNITTIKVFDYEDVKSITTDDWLKTKSGYTQVRENLPQAFIEYTTTEDDNGLFKIENIPYGKYVILIDKDFYSDVIITNIVIDEKTQDIDFSDEKTFGEYSISPTTIEYDTIEEFHLTPDINKDGLLDSNDTIAYNKDYKLSKNGVINLDDIVARRGNNDSNDTLIYNRAYQAYGKNRKTQVRKYVVEFK